MTYVITAKLPIATENGIITSYETNYFCRRLTTPTGIKVNEWDSDKNFAQEFTTKEGAKKFCRDFIDMDGLKIVPFK